MASILWAAEPPRVDVFVSGADGYAAYRIPTVVRADDGTLIAFAEGRRGGKSDTGDIDLLAKRSRDGGQTWSDAILIWDDGVHTCGNPAPVVDRTTGTIWLGMTRNLGTDHENDIIAGRSKERRRVFITHSKDVGRTWAPPSEITDAVADPTWRWYATGPVNGIQLVRGDHRDRLVIPCNHTVPAENRTPEVNHSHVIFSDDHGVTWQRGGAHGPATNESTIVELSDGSLLQNMRSPGGAPYRRVSTSADAGMTWSEDRDDQTLIEPVCQGSLLRYAWPEEGASRILFCNPSHEKKRENLTVKMSLDEGMTWSFSKPVYAGSSAYSCLVKLADGRVGVLFERDGYARISFAAISIDQFQPVAPKP